MKWLVLIAIVVLVLLASTSYAAVYAYCPTCPECAYLGYPCPIPPSYYNPEYMHSYNEYFHFGGYDNVNGIFNLRPDSPYPPYLGIDASRQWFALPPR